MKVFTKKLLFTGYTVRLSFEGKTFPTCFQGSLAQAEAYATRIRKSLNRSGTKKRLTAAAGM